MKRVRMPGEGAVMNTSAGFDFAAAAFRCARSRSSALRSLYFSGTTQPGNGESEKLLRRPQVEDVLDILRTYAATCLPIPRTTERFYWSVSCLPGSPDKPLARISASFMELFALQLADPPLDFEGRGTGEAGGGALRARFILHLSDFTTDGSPEPDHLDQALLTSCGTKPEDVSHFFWKADTFGEKVQGSASIRAFLANPHAIRAIRRFNLTHMNRGRNAYQASHCYSVADAMLE